MVAEVVPARLRQARSFRRRASDGAIRVLIVGQVRLFAAAIGQALAAEAALQVVGVISEDHDSVESWCAFEPDVVLLECGPSLQEPASLLIALRAKRPHTKIVVLSTAVTESEMALCLKHGAAGYISGDTTIAEVIHAI